ncbi:MAG: flagellar hook assembly protein FlgD [Candidatus Anammoxibacter sp.]
MVGNISSINDTTGNTGFIDNAVDGLDIIKDLDRNAFLTLFVAQLANQDPLAPSENGDFIADLAQFSALESLEELTDLAIEQNEILGDSLEGSQVTELLQELEIATSLIGKDITYATEDGSTASGTIDGVKIGDDSLFFNVGGVQVPITALLEIT